MYPMKGGMRVSTERLLCARLWESKAITLNDEMWGFVCLWPQMECKAQGQAGLQPWLRVSSMPPPTCSCDGSVGCPP